MRLQTCTNGQDSRKLSIETGMAQGNYTRRTGGQQKVAEEKRVAAHQTNSGALLLLLLLCFAKGGRRLGDPSDEVIQPVVGRSNHYTPVRHGWSGLTAHRLHGLCKLTGVEEAVVSLDQHPTDQQISTSG